MKGSDDRQQALSRRLDEMASLVELMSQRVGQLESHLREHMESGIREIQARLRDLERSLGGLIAAGPHPERPVCGTPGGRDPQVPAIGDEPATFARVFEQVCARQSEIGNQLRQIRETMENDGKGGGAALQSVLSQLERTMHVAAREVRRMSRDP